MEQTRKTKTEGRRPRAWTTGMWLGRRPGQPEPANKAAELARDYGASVYEVKP